MQQVALASLLLAKGENMSAYPHLLKPLDLGFTTLKPCAYGVYAYWFRRSTTGI